MNDQKECDAVEMNCLVSEDVIKEKNATSFLCRHERHVTEWADANVTQPVLLNWVDAMRHQHDVMKDSEDAVVKCATVKNHSCLHEE